jgi:hypothetical protein
MLTACLAIACLSATAIVAAVPQIAVGIVKKK